MKKKARKRGRYGDGCIYHQEGSRNWYISWYEPTRQPDGTIKRTRHYASTHSDDRQVAQRALRTKLQLVGGRRPTVVDPQKVSYEDLRENIFQYLIMKNRPSLKLNAKGEPKFNTRTRLDKFFGGWRAGEISIAVLKRFRIEGKRDGLSDERLNRYMAGIRKMFNQALKDELITRAEMPPYFPMTTEPNVARGAVYIKREWYGPLRKALKEPLRSAFTLAYYAATRPGELQKIHWRDVNVKERIVTLPAEITKTGKTRLVPLPRDFDRKPGQPDELVFPLGDCRERWRTACVKVGAGYYKCRECGSRCEGRTCPTHGELHPKKVRYHGALLRHCRHTANRHMAEAGMDEKRRMEISGHTTSAMSQRYNIGREGDVARAREVMDRFHGGRV
jgi:integrase